MVNQRLDFHCWLFGHYHDNKKVTEKHILMWEQIVQVVLKSTPWEEIVLDFTDEVCYTERVESKVTTGPVLLE